MFRNGTPQVLIAGAGPVGLFAALSLTKRGVPVEIVDTGIWACSHSYALALHSQSLHLLEELDLLDQVVAGAYRVNSIGLYDRTRQRARIDLGNHGVAVLPQADLEHLLESKLDKSGVRVLWRHEVSEIAAAGDHVDVSLDRYEKESRGYVVARSEWVVAGSKQVQVPYVIGADGYNSNVRRSLGIDFPEVGAAQYYAVFECKTDADLGSEMRLMLGDGTADILWPLPGGCCRWSFELKDYSDPEADRYNDFLRAYGLPTVRSKDRMAVSHWQAPVLEESSLHSLIAERAPWFKGTIEDVGWRTVVRFERRLAGSFGRGRGWLAGDAAHLTGPGGIQSLNVGLAEAHDLAAALKCSNVPSALEAYNARWSAAWRQLHNQNGGMQASGADPWIAAHAGQILPCLPAHGHELSDLARQLGVML